MFINYLKIAWRNIKRHKGYSIINIAGLSVGMACFLLILLFSQYEFSYEQHHENADRIYRINVEQQLTDRVFRAQTSPVPLAEALYNEFPDIITFTRFESLPTFLVQHGDRRYYEKGVLLVDPGVLGAFAIFIACLGLFGLASFAAEQRTKEIGIRKVLGANVSGIVVLLSKEFTRWVLVANVIAWPLAYLAMYSWLRGFAYRININSQIGFFLVAAVGALFIAWVTVSFQAVKAATSDPVDSLRYE